MLETEIYNWNDLLKFEITVCNDSSLIIQENLKGVPQYKLDINENDVLLDIGANVGTVSLFASLRCKSVIAVEAAYDNFRLLVRNIELNKIANIIPLNNAVTYHNQFVKLFMDRNRSGCHTLRPTRGRTAEQVKAININDLLETYQPNKIKMDCEYGEYEIIPNVKPENWDMIDAISIEFHCAQPRVREPYLQCLDILKQHFKHTDCGKWTRKQWCTVEHFYKSEPKPEISTKDWLKLRSK
jgi:FkbM family methyltransferase